MLLLHKGYYKQQHALCLAPPPLGTDTCFMDVIKYAVALSSVRISLQCSLITKGVIPANATSNMNMN